MNCKKCDVVYRCKNDGDRTGAAKYYPCSRDTFYDATYRFCDRENCGVAWNMCYFCCKCTCKDTAECGNMKKGEITNV